jgi:hypothetical protein
VISFTAEGKPLFRPILLYMGIKPPHKDTVTPRQRERERELDLKEKLALPSTNEKNQ